MRALRLAAWLLPAALLLLPSCGAPQNQDKGDAGPETVDVAPAIDVSPEGDVKAAPPRKGLVGVLPDGFPRELPIYLPSSVIDFGGSFALLQSPDSRATVEGWLRGALRQAGFQVSGGGGGFALERGGKRYRVVVTAQGSTSRIRYEY